MNNEPSKVLGGKLRDAREEKGFTQKEVGDFLGYSSMAISHFENGIRELKSSDLQKLSEYLTKPLTFFFSDAQSPAPLYRNHAGNDPDVARALEQFDNLINSMPSDE
jgi:transcriptional regulator with XRE-family HTH domain